MSASVSVTNWYAIGGVSLLVSVILLRVGRVYGSMLRSWLNRHLIYPLLLCDVTRLQAVLLVIYGSVNAIVLALFPERGPALEQRAALVSALNIVTVFLGGRTNPLIDRADVSVRTYYFWHFWAGRVIAIQGLLHAAVHIARQASRSDSLVISGWIVSLLLFLLLIGSLPFFRRRSYVVFIKVHFILVLATLAGLIWHVLAQNLFNKAPVFIAAVLWFLSTTYRISLYLKWRRGASVTGVHAAAGGMHLKVQLGKPLRPYPGMYFYLYFSGLPIRYKWYGFPTNAFFWRLSPGEDSTRDLHFLLQERDSLAQLDSGRSLQNIAIEGPYGKNMRAETYETVILIAEGVGIAGVLPYALHLAQRRQHDQRFRTTNTAIFRDVTRKVDLLWKLNHGNEEQWCKDELTELMSMDSKKTLLSGRLFYPSNNHRKLEIPKEFTKFWKSYSGLSDKNVDDNIQHYIKWNSQYPGRSIAIVCGSRAFCRRAREFIVTTPRLAVDFAEPEFIPAARKTEPAPNPSRITGNRWTMFRKTPLNPAQTHKRNRNLAAPNKSLEDFQNSCRSLPINTLRKQVKEAGLKQSNKQNKENLVHRLANYLWNVEQYKTYRLDYLKELAQLEEDNEITLEKAAQIIARDRVNTIYKMRGDESPTPDMSDQGGPKTPPAQTVPSSPNLSSSDSTPKADGTSQLLISNVPNQGEPKTPPPRLKAKVLETKVLKMLKAIKMIKVMKTKIPKAGTPKAKVLKAKVLETKVLKMLKAIKIMKVMKVMKAKILQAKIKVKILKAKIKVKILKAKIKVKILQAKIKVKILQAKIKVKILKAKIKAKILKAKIKVKILKAKIKAKILKAKIKVKIPKAGTPKAKVLKVLKAPETKIVLAKKRRVSLQINRRQVRRITSRIEQM
ncbi:hypothetical protein NUW58_g6202 [Xylaria curta]|uniref:Uncharacterized protein n=1 Tax=Xylaria curta TaxID=42375 RepID=A0ACC1NXX0_9PEZI|nr:hypothetical protein NUW58_g6202 [Xylaria curta]